ncbi:MAG: ABC transporter ATP-binding protein [Lachnospiraceae bacterium]|nr:ABC transporter ATP-binding protein [Lachnospiraceae bacterium]
MLLEIKDVCKRLGNFKLKNISLQLPAGYILGLIGPNGAGKTSLIHLILGLYEPNEGEILIDGLSYTDHEVDIREKLGTVLLEDLFVNGLTLKENASRFGEFYKNYSEEILLKYLNRFHLDADRKFKQLSKGEKLKFQFAFALSHDAKLLILDEPTGNFDPTFRAEFFEVLKEFIADGQRSIILSTHLTEDLDRIADYICYLEKGETIFAGDIESLRDKYRLVVGEEYKIKLLRKDDIIYLEKGEFTNRALVINRPSRLYDALKVTVPTIEELMYFMTKRGKKS